jgi:hypothetical protein
VQFNQRDVLLEELPYCCVAVGTSAGACCVGVSVGIAGGGDVFVGGTAVGGSLVDVAVGGNCVTVGVIVGSGVGVGMLSVIVTRRSA